MATICFGNIYHFDDRAHYGQLSNDQSRAFKSGKKFAHRIKYCLIIEKISHDQQLHQNRLKAHQEKQGILASQHDGAFAWSHLCVIDFTVDPGRSLLQ
jgi:hypothetical protein